ncbi:MAG: hypothetical protein DRN08_05515, partial [Thermoplasmata archaeon]
PQIELTPSSYDFGNVAVGEYSDYTFTLENIGGQTATGTITITGDEDFTILTGGGSISLEPSEEKSIKIRFAPSSEGKKTATLQADGNPPCNDDSSSLAGTGYTPEPSLEVDPTELDFETPPNGTQTKTFKVRNAGGKTLEWNATEDIEWVTEVQPDHGSLPADGEQTVQVKVKAPDTPGEDYYGDLYITSNGGDKTVSLHLHVKGSDIDVYPTSVSFDLEPKEEDSETINIKNIGYGTLHWEIRENIDWLDINPRTGELERNQEETVEITVLAPDKPNRDYSKDFDIINLDNAQDKETVIVNLHVRGPKLDVTPTTINLGKVSHNTPEIKDYFTIKNVGDSEEIELNWEVHKPWWVSRIEPEDGTLEKGETAKVWVYIHPDELDWSRDGKRYSDQIVISSNGGDATIDISFTNSLSKSHRLERSRSVTKTIASISLIEMRKSKIHLFPL